MDRLKELQAKEDLTEDEKKELAGLENGIIVSKIDKAIVENSSISADNSTNIDADFHNSDSVITEIIQQNTNEIEEKENSRIKASEYQKNKAKKDDADTEEKSPYTLIVWLLFVSGVLYGVYRFFLSNPLNKPFTAKEDTTTEDTTESIEHKTKQKTEEKRQSNEIGLDS